MTSNNSLKPIVHVATDEKFIDAAYEIYERAFPGQNRFVILLNDEKNIKHLSADKKYCYLHTDDDFVSGFASRYKNASIFVFHGMNYAQSLVALSLGDDQNLLIWTVFGNEVYKNPYIFGKEIFGKKTYRRFVFSIKNKVKNFLRPSYYYLIKGRQDANKSILSAFRKMHKVGILYKEEYRLYKKRINFDNKVEHLKFTYYPIDVVMDKNNGPVTDNNILVGNSAYSTNNHLEAFDILQKMNLEDRTLITPLSYGNEEYASAIAKEGNMLFNANFKALTKFLPLKEYQKILQTCGIVVMNHYRQQAVGNVLNTLFLGSKVYLSKKNTLYHYLKRIGCHIYAIEDDLRSNNPHTLALLSDQQMKDNRELLRTEISLERMCDELKKTFNPYLI